MITSQLLTWDTDFFGIKIFKIEVTEYSVPDIEKSVQEAFAAGAELIYLIIPDDIDKKEVFLSKLIDQKVIFGKTLKEGSDQNANIFEYSGETVTPKLYNIALESGKYSRFKIDNKLPYDSYEKLYKKWIEKSVSGQIADKVFVYSENNDLLGMITLKLKDDHGEIGLLASDYAAQGKGIGSKLIAASEDFVIAQNIFRMEVATQFNNSLACRFYEKNGYTIKNILNYYHLWKN
jgi:dTDP-4-amino-4,6-dideoxy-D-galactose acyltransferase